MEEIWKDIEGYEGLYQVSNLGRVKSLERLVFYSDGRSRVFKEQILKPSKEYDYLYVILYKNNENKHFRIHRLVANTFIDNPNNYPYINHIDECKSNNNVNNLEWCSPKYNVNYGSCIKRRVEKQSKQIYCLENDTMYKSISECGRKLHLSIGNISSVLNKRRKQTKGYTFRYANQVLYKGEK